MQESSIWGVHQTHSATRDDDGSGGKRDQTESHKAGENTRAHTLSCTNSLGALGQARGGAHVAYSASQLCCTRANSTAQHAGHARTTTNPAEARGRGRARAREPGELTRGASAELVRASKTFVAALVLERREQHRRKGLRGQNDVARRKRPLRDDAQPAPGAARRRNLEPLIEVPLARIVPPRRERPAVGRAPCAHRAAPPEQREQQGGRGSAHDRVHSGYNVRIRLLYPRDHSAWCRGDTARALGSGALCPSSAATPRAARR